jgi:hypothetical protein
MLQAVPLLPTAVTIDLYGPLDDYSEAELATRGVVVSRIVASGATKPWRNSGAPRARVADVSRRRMPGAVVGAFSLACR